MATGPANFMKMLVDFLQLYGQKDKLASGRSCINRHSTTTRKHL